jgi:hypothetical protein
MITLIGGIVACMVGAVTLLALGHPDAAWWVGNCGVFIWLLIVLTYIVFWDSKKRWPGTTAFERYANVMTFRR